MELQNIYKASLYLQKSWEETKGKRFTFDIIKDNMTKVQTIFVCKKMKVVNGYDRTYYSELLTEEELPEAKGYYGYSIENFYGFRFSNYKPAGYNMYGAPDETSIPASVNDFGSSLLELEQYLNANSKESMHKILSEARSIAQARLDEYQQLFPQNPIVKQPSLQETEELRKKLSIRLKKE